MIARYTLPEMRDLWSDESKYEHWLKVELALLWAQDQLGRLPAGAFNAISQHTGFSVARIGELDAVYDHDMIAFVQTVREVLQQSGVPQPVADLFHQKHTSYDIEDPAVMLQLLTASKLILEKLHLLHQALLNKARETRIHMIARTHLQFAEPTVFGQLLLVYAEAVGRAIEDIGHVVDTNLAVGKMSGAIGTYAGLDSEEEQLACEHLGLQPAKVATQILQRDRHARLLSALTTAAGSIEQLAMTFWIMMHSCIREAQEPRKKKQRGSSAMPYKANPILTERLMGLPRLMRGYLIAAQENIRIPEWRDISQSSVERVIFPDATTVIHYMVDKATKLVDGLVLFPENMAANLHRALGVWAGQRIRYALVERGISDNDAYLLVQRASFRAVGEQVHLQQILGQEPISENDSRTAAAVLGSDDLPKLFDVESYIQNGIRVIYSRFFPDAT